MGRRRKPNRGVVLLVVISMLVLFVLIVVTFALVAGQYRAAAKIHERVDAAIAGPDTDIDKIFYQLLRDTKFRSAIQGHGLLTDLYGNGVRGQIAAVNTTANGQFLDLFFNGLANTRNSTGRLAYDNRQFRPLAGFYNGRILTVLSGNAGSASTRIVGYSPAQFNAAGVQISQGVFRVEVFESDVGGIVAPGAGDVFLVNGAPFNGTGAGLNPATQTVDLRTWDPGLDGGWGVAGMDDDGINGIDDPGEAGAGDDLALPVVLLPNYSAHLYSPLSPIWGGANEPYDVANYNDMQLGSYPPVDPLIMTPAGQLINRTIPSFHRPDLVNYWFQQLRGSVLSGVASLADQALVFQFPYGIDNARGINPATGINDDDSRPIDSDGDGLPDTSSGVAMGVTLAVRDQVVRIKRMIMPRPLNELNPGFAQSNPGFMRSRILTNGELEWNFQPDVDTDGDGVPDSVWIDPGLPPHTGRDGRRVKTMVAVRVEDLDGRLSLNAHGSVVHLPANGWGPQFPIANSAGSGAASAALPRGLGYGPAEINLSAIFGLSAEYQTLINSRYGNDGPPGIVGAAGVYAADDTLSAFKSFEMFDNFFFNNLMSGSHASPFDVWGRGAICLDHFGQPQFLGNMATGDRVDDPYEINIVEPSKASSDAPFTVAELEKLLQWNHLDSAELPNRIMNLAPNTFNYGPNAALLRHSVTTNSSHIPAVMAPYNNVSVAGSSVRTALFSNRPEAHILQIYARRLLAGGVTPANLANEMSKLVPTEMLHGELFDINRPIGNGLDDDGDGIVDEPDEAGFEGIWNNAYPPYAGRAVVSRLNDDPVLVDPRSSRQVLARHLYCLAMLLKDDGVEIDFDNNSGNNTPQETAYGLAQWAVNVVDFRDSDSIMTAFEFDIEPFQNGWNVDGVIDSPGNPSPDDTSAPRGLVWGCERPELLISETLAFHDRRTQDLSNPNGRTTDAMNPDAHFDQRLRPRGAFFVELYNPWTASTKRPAEFYSTAFDGVRLNARVGGLANGSPIWRLVVVQENSLTADLDSPSPAIATPVQPADIERTIYFTDPTTSAVLIPDPGTQYYTNDSVGNPIPMAPILPGRYAVIGPPGEQTGNPASYVTTIGRLTVNATNDLAGVANTRRIILTPSANPNVNQVSTANMMPGALPPAVTVKPEPVLPGPGNSGDRMPAIAIIVDAPHPLSVSEPTGGYTAANFMVTPTNPEGEYNPPIDEPLDWNRENNRLRTNQTIASFRIVHLQRLADPTQPFDAALNPFRTIDSSYVNLTAFNGIATGEADGFTRFHSFQRGDSDTQNPYPYAISNDPVAGPEAVAFQRRLWRHEPPTLPVPGPVASSDAMPVSNLVNDHVFQFGLRNSLGYLNNNYWPYFTQAAAPNVNYRGAPDARNAQANDTHAFPWLVWNNRPFTSPLELMLVPWPRSSRLPSRFDMTAPGDPYTSPTPHFQHLLNFFHSEQNTPAHLYRIFDYMAVRSPYIGAEKWYFPGLDTNGDGDCLDAGELPGFGGPPFDIEAASFRPPYNRLSRFRDPGRVNLNTVAIQGTRSPVLETIFGDFIPAANMGAAVNAIRLSRQGFNDPPGGALYNSAFPSMFTNPLRPESSADMMPDIQQGGNAASNMRRDGQGGHQAPIDATLLRRSIGAGSGLFDNNSTYSYSNSDRNPYFRYQAQMKIANLFTSQSNVYAIWLTVGHFELEPTFVNPAHPEGLRLGREVGSERGEIKRHRAFFIVDRSIPVAFEAGENHNVDRCVLLRRVEE